MKKYSDLLAIWIWFYIVIIVPPLFLISTLHLLIPDVEVIHTLAEQIPALSDLVIISPLLAGIGALFNYISHRIKFVSILNLPRNKISVLLANSLLISFVLWRYVDILRSWGYVGLLTLLIFFLFYLPFVASYFRSISFSSFKRILPGNNIKQMPPSELIKNYLFFILVLLAINMAVFLTGTFMGKLHKQLYIISKSPKINSYQPKIIYYSNKVILTGKNFGWKGAIQTNFRYQKGFIDIDLWTDNKIIFTVPLHWPIGKIYVWIESPVATSIVKSNVVTLHLISRDNGWDKEDDAYFGQLNSLKKETLEVNGYQ